MGLDDEGVPVAAPAGTPHVDGMAMADGFGAPRVLDSADVVVDAPHTWQTPEQAASAPPAAQPPSSDGDSDAGSRGGSHGSDGDRPPARAAYASPLSLEEVSAVDGAFFDLARRFGFQRAQDLPRSLAPRSNVENQLEHFKHLMSIQMLRRRGLVDSCASLPPRGSYSGLAGVSDSASQSRRRLRFGFYSSRRVRRGEDDLTDALLGEASTTVPPGGDKEEDADAAGHSFGAGCFSWELVQAVQGLHAKLLGSYVSYAEFVKLPTTPEANRVMAAMASPVNGERDVEEMVRQVALYLLVWGEAANLRHCPECLWLLYHCMLHSPEYGNPLGAYIVDGTDTSASSQLHTPTPTALAHASSAAEGAAGPGVQRALGHDSASSSPPSREGSCGGSGEAVFVAAAAPLTFLHRLVAPIYAFLCAEISYKDARQWDAQVDPAVPQWKDRSHYDDLNEWFWRPELCEQISKVTVDISHVFHRSDAAADHKSKTATVPVSYHELQRRVNSLFPVAVFVVRLSTAQLGDLQRVAAEYAHLCRAYGRRVALLIDRDVSYSDHDEEHSVFAELVQRLKGVFHGVRSAAGLATQPFLWVAVDVNDASALSGGAEHIVQGFSEGYNIDCLQLCRKHLRVHARDRRTAALVQAAMLQHLASARQTGAAASACGVPLTQLVQRKTFVESNSWAGYWDSFYGVLLFYVLSFQCFVQIAFWRFVEPSLPCYNDTEDHNDGLNETADSNTLASEGQGESCDGGCNQLLIFLFALAVTEATLSLCSYAYRWAAGRDISIVRNNRSRVSKLVWLAGGAARLCLSAVVLRGLLAASSTTTADCSSASGGKSTLPLVGSVDGIAAVGLAYLVVRVALLLLQSGVLQPICSALGAACSRFCCAGTSQQQHRSIHAGGSAKRSGWVSRLLVGGKGLPVPRMLQLRYFCFWLLILVPRVLFGYYFEVYPNAQSTVDIWNYIMDGTSSATNSESGAASTGSSTDPIDKLLAYLSLVTVLFMWLPIFLMYVVNSFWFWQFFTLLWGSLGGVMNKTGHVSTWSQLVQLFRPPARRAHHGGGSQTIIHIDDCGSGGSSVGGARGGRCNDEAMPEIGRLLSRKILRGGDWAALWDRIVVQLHREDYLSLQEVRTFKASTLMQVFEPCIVDASRLSQIQASTSSATPAGSNTKMMDSSMRSNSNTSDSSSDAAELREVLFAAARGPKNDEARRVLLFFASSLFQDSLRPPPPLQQVPSMGVLTPHFRERVAYSCYELLSSRCLPTSYSKSQQQQMMHQRRLVLTSSVERNNPTPTLLEYLSTLFADEWDNFLERHGYTDELVIRVCSHFKQYQGAYDPMLPGEMPAADQEVMSRLCWWASVRGQTLARTVRGVAQYRAALDELAQHEQQQHERSFRHVSDEARDRETSRRGSSSSLSGDDASCSSKASRANSCTKPLCMEEGTLLGSLHPSNRFRHIVASQEFGSQSTEQRRPMLNLMKMFPEMQVAYVSKHRQLYTSNVNAVASVNHFEETYSSVLEGVARDASGWLMHNADGTVATRPLVEVLLPGNPIVGEGKPENQNHAMVFVHEEFLQTLDMNQDGYFAEALKMRQLLGEFSRHNRPHGSSDGSHRAGGGDASDANGGHLAIVGFREHIFTKPANLVASFSASMEFTFTTIIQRMLASPLCVRMHYGHPDVFDKLWMMPRGSCSKATKGLHLSEDVFAGLNATLRRGRVQYREYIQMGKGREAEFDSINTFEEKVAAGNGAQCKTRDFHRLGNAVDWPRQMSLYHSSLGFYGTQTFIVWALYAYLYFVLLLAITGTESLDFEVQLFNVQMLQLVSQTGILAFLLYFAELSVERGPLYALVESLHMFCSGMLLFFAFVTRTRAYALDRSVLTGAAIYKGTTRDFAIEHRAFAINYRSFSRSHILPGVKVVTILVFLRIVTELSGSFWRHTAVTWLVALSWVLAPLWFNPRAFSLFYVQREFAEWLDWILTSVTPALAAVESKKDDAAYSWRCWWMTDVREARASATPANKLTGLLRAVPDLLLACAAVSSLHYEKLSKLLVFVVVVALTWLLIWVAYLATRSSISGGLASNSCSLHSSEDTSDFLSDSCNPGGLTSRHVRRDSSFSTSSASSSSAAASARSPLTTRFRRTSRPSCCHQMGAACSCKLVTLMCVYTSPVLLIVGIVLVEKLLLLPPPANVPAVATLGAGYNLVTGNPIDFSQGVTYDAGYTYSIFDAERLWQAQDVSGAAFVGQHGIATPPFVRLTQAPNGGEGEDGNSTSSTWPCSAAAEVAQQDVRFFPSAASYRSTVLDHYMCVDRDGTTDPGRGVYSCDGAEDYAASADAKNSSGSGEGAGGQWPFASVAEMTGAIAAEACSANSQWIQLRDSVEAQYCAAGDQCHVWAAARASCQAYQAELILETAAPASSALADAFASNFRWLVANLPATCEGFLVGDPDAGQDPGAAPAPPPAAAAASGRATAAGDATPPPHFLLVDHYGTHVATRVALGAQEVVLSQIRQKDYELLQQERRWTAAQWEAAAAAAFNMQMGLSLSSDALLLGMQYQGLTLRANTLTRGPPVRAEDEEQGADGAGDSRNVDSKDATEAWLARLRGKRLTELAALPTRNSVLEPISRFLAAAYWPGEDAQAMQLRQSAIDFMVGAFGSCAADARGMSRSDCIMATFLDAFSSTPTSPCYGRPVTPTGPRPSTSPPPPPPPSGEQDVEWSIGPFTVGEATSRIGAGSQDSVSTQEFTYDASKPSVYKDLHTHVAANVGLLLLGDAFFTSFVCSVIYIFASTSTAAVDDAPGVDGHRAGVRKAALALLVNLVEFLAWSLDLLVGSLMFVLLFALSFLSIVDSIHTMLLYGTRVSAWKKM